MKTYLFILFCILIYTGSYAQDRAEPYEDSITIRILQRVLDQPNYPVDSVGIIVFQFEKNNDSLVLQSLYSSLNQYKLPTDYSIRMYPSSISVKPIPDGYKRIVRFDFYFNSDNGKLTLPSDEVKLQAEKMVESYKGKVKVLPYMTTIGYPPSCIKKTVTGLSPIPPKVFQP
jgi:hypothetical protein